MCIYTTAYRRKNDVLAWVRTKIIPATCAFPGTIVLTKAWLNRYLPLRNLQPLHFPYFFHMISPS